MEVQRKREADWSELGDDALECVLRKLSFVDKLRFKMVCPSWSSVAESYSSSPFNPFSKTPWLVLPPRKAQFEEVYDEVDDEEDDDSLRFFNLGEKKEYRDVCKCEEFHNCSLVGSSYGWLLLQVQSESRDLVAFNPFSGVRIRVAPSRCRLIKAFLTSDPRSGKDKNLEVVVFHRYIEKLAFCWHKDGKFIDLKSAYSSYQDLTSYNNNLVCGLSCKGFRRANVEVWDLSGSFPTKTMDMILGFPKKTADFCTSGDTAHPRKFYLVESSGKLLFVARFLTGDSENRRTCETMLFHVYRLDWIEKKWVEVETLGDQSLFIGEHHSMSLKAGDCGGCIGNSIYFTDPPWFLDYDINRNVKVRNVGVYSLEDASLKSIYEINSGKNHSHPFWIVPSPCCDELV